MVSAYFNPQAPQMWEHSSLSLNSRLNAIILQIKSGYYHLKQTDLVMFAHPRARALNFIIPFSPFVIMIGVQCVPFSYDWRADHVLADLYFSQPQCFLSSFFFVGSFCAHRQIFHNTELSVYFINIYVNVTMSWA